MHLLDKKHIGSIRLKYFPTPADYFYYELFLVDGELDPEEDCGVDNYQLGPIFKISDELSSNLKNTLQFVYKKKVLVNKKLSDYELIKLLEVINEIKLYIKMKPEKLSLILPDILHTIFLETNQISVKYSWMTSDELSNSRKMKELKKITVILSEILNIDYSKLDMPSYK